MLDFSLISQFPDETVKITPAFRAGKVSLFLVENTNYIAVQAVGLIRRFKTVFSPKAIVYVPFLQETKHNKLNPKNPACPVK